MRNGRGYFNFRPHPWRRHGANSSGGSAAARSNPGQPHDAVHKAEAFINHALESISEARKQVCCSCEPNAVAEFNDRIKEYIALHRKLANETGEINDTKKPAEITLREQELGKLIRANRAAAKQGDIITPVVQALFKGIIKQEYARRTAAMRKDRKEDQDELADFAPVVNQTYPPEKPLVTFPAGLLRTLPKLPRELEYRLVQRNLILRDIEANIIVDFIPAATP
jgi:hypothetical protein